MTAEQKMGWYLVYAKPRRESVARDNLERQGFETYLPLMRTRRRRGRRYETVVESMFPRYLFVHLDREHQNWAPIRSTLGVSSLVRFGDRPARVPDSLIEGLRAAEDEEGIQQHAPADFKAGDRVRIAEGPMAGYEAVFWARNGNDRVTVLLEIANQQARVDVQSGDIESAR